MSQTVSLLPYKITFQEYVDFNLHFLGRHYRHLKSWFVFLPAPLMVAAIGYIRLSDLDTGKRIMYALLSFALAFAVCAILIQGWALARCLMVFKKTPIANGEMQVTTTDEQLITSLPDQEGRYKWGGLHDIVESKKIIFIYPTPQSAILIPKRIFSTPSEAESFLMDIRKRWQTSKETKLTPR